MKKHAMNFTAIIGVVLLIAGILALSSFTTKPFLPGEGLQSFKSYEELEKFVNDNTSYSESMYARGGMVGVAESDGVQTGAPSSGKDSSTDYSTTNIQVTGVDEADFVKNDGEFIYLIPNSDNYYYGYYPQGQSEKKVAILKAYPAQDAEVRAEIKFTEKETPRALYLNGDDLIVLGEVYEQFDAYTGGSGSTGSEKVASSIWPGSYYDYKTSTFVKVFNVADKSNPKLTQDYSVTGNYYNSRLISNRLVVISQDYLHRIRPLPLIESLGGNASLGRISMPEVTSNGQTTEVKATEVLTFGDYDYSYNFTNVLGVNLDSGTHDLKTYLTGYTQNLFVSLENLYFTYQKNLSPRQLFEMRLNALADALPADVASKIRMAVQGDKFDYERETAIGIALQEYMNSLNRAELEDFYSKLADKMREVEKKIFEETSKTVIQKVAVTNLEHKARGEVPGTPLNQFSMDEYNGEFRIATTQQPNFWWGPWAGVARADSTVSSDSITPEQKEEEKQKNHVYVLNSNLDVVGRLENLAPSEQIYSARFLGNRLYLVTFKRIDPLFVIDLQDSTNPRVLGKLKIPGYSDYLHPYDETHLIGIGKEATAGEGDFAWYQGVKLALFDVSDPSNPREVSKYEIGDRGTDSYALRDHHAFTFSKSKNLLVIPITLAEIDESKFSDEELKTWAYGDFVWQGAFAFSLTKEEGFTLLGRVSHDENKKDPYWYYGDQTSVKRSLYIGDVLYTVSSSVVKMNSLPGLEGLNSISFVTEFEQMPDQAYDRSCGLDSDCVKSLMPDSGNNCCETCDFEAVNEDAQSARESWRVENCQGSQACTYIADCVFDERTPYCNEGSCDLKEPEREPPTEGFCGTSTEAECSTDSDCETGGCSGQVCQGASEEEAITTCEWRECYDAEEFGASCGCVEGKCQWS